LIVWVAYGVWDNWRVVATALPVVPLVFGLGWHAGQMVSMSFDRGAWRQAGVLHEAPATDLVDLQATLRDLSALHGGGAREANIDVAVADLVTDSLVPVLRWQLRDFPNTRFSAAVPVDPAPLVLTPVEEQPLIQAYSGAEFAILQRWMPMLAADAASSLRWILYRETYTPPEKVRIILWVNKAG